MPRFLSIADEGQDDVVVPKSFIIDQNLLATLLTTARIDPVVHPFVLRLASEAIRHRLHRMALASLFLNFSFMEK